MKKKLIGLALSAAMLFSVLSVPAFAAAPEESADPALTTEQTAAEEENCFFTSSSTEEEKEPNSITYVALGDSICAGIGLTTVQYAHNLMGVDVSFNFKGYPEACYVGQVGKSLNLDRDHAINLGLPAVMTKDLADLIETGAMPAMNHYSGVQYTSVPELKEYIQKADLITLQIGANDALIRTIVALGEATNWKSEDLASIVLSGNLRGSSKETEDALNESLKKLSLTRSEKDAVWNLFFSGMNKICENAYPESSSNLRQIVATVKELNPDAQILIIGATNPVPLLPSWSDYFSKLNNYEKQLADVYGATYVSIPFAQTELDGHPTVSGHKYIADKIVKAIEAQQ